MTDARDIVDRLHLAATDAIHDDAKADILEAIQTIANLEAENFVLAAGSCDVEGGKIGDEHGHFYCTLQVENASLRKQLEDARGLLDRLCTAYVLVCDDNGTRYYESESSVYAHAKAEALKGKS